MILLLFYRKISSTNYFGNMKHLHFRMAFRALSSNIKGRTFCFRYYYCIVRAKVLTKLFISVTLFYVNQGNQISDTRFLQ